MEIKSIFCIVACSIFISCSNNQLQKKYESQIKVAYDLIGKIKNYDTTGVKKMVGIELGYVGMNDELLLFRIEQLHDVLKEYYLSDSKSFYFKEYSPQSPLLVDITIPLENSKKENRNNYRVLISFAKFIDKTKVLNFQIINGNDNNKTK
jgi:hypothetical protein